MPLPLRRALPLVCLPLALSLLGCEAPRQAQLTLSGCAAVEAVWGGPGDWRPDPAPILEPGPPGAWDSVDALNPSVARFGNGWINLYSGFDGKVWRTGAALSDDGRHWRKAEGGPVLAPDPASWEGDYIAANGATAVRDGRLWHWYQAGPRNQTQLGLAVSDDGRAWRKDPNPVFGPGAGGAWGESGVGDPYVLACGEHFYLFYLGQNRWGVQRLGVARSSDGRHWQRSHRNPILEPGGPGEFDERGLGEPAVLFAANEYWMLYVGRDGGERRRLGWARSADGVRWSKSGPVLAGSEGWNEAVVCDPEWVVIDGGLHVLYGGGDRPSPDENLNGRIGLARLSPKLGTNAVVR